MNTQQIERHFGDKASAMKQIGCKSRQLWRHWSINGIPEGQQYKIQALTDGKLKVNGKRK